MNRRTALGFVVAVATVAIWFAARPKPVTLPAPPATPAEPSALAPVSNPALKARVPTATPTPEVSAPEDPVASPAEPPGTPPPPNPAPAALSLPGSVETDLEGVQFMIRDFRTSMRENPVGNNAEITSALLGQNLKQVKLPVPVGSRLNETNELVDRWGTPYFFHQVSRDKMEVRSAGPDRVMWTGDDQQQ